MNMSVSRAFSARPRVMHTSVRANTGRLGALGTGATHCCSDWSHFLGYDFIYAYLLTYYAQDLKPPETRRGPIVLHTYQELPSGREVL